MPEAPCLVTLHPQREPRGAHRAVSPLAEGRVTARLADGGLRVLHKTRVHPH
jgi:hypothetical protein